jgi:predicted permease
MRTIVKRILAVFRRRRLDREMDDEVGLHLAMLEDEFRARGMPPAEAKLAARREFGGVALAQEKYRERRGLPWLENTARDVRYAVRGLRRNPGFTAAAVLSLGLGIGANTAVFSLFHALMLRSLPVARPEELVEIYRAGSYNIVSYPLYEEVARRTDLFAGVLARTGSDQDPAASTRGFSWEYVSGSYFRVLGVTPAVGRLLDEADNRAGNRVAVLNYDFWQRRFGGAPDAVGRVLGGLTVIGVAARGFRGVDLDHHPDLWIPVALNPNEVDSPRFSWLSMLARLRPEVSRAQAQAALDVLVAQHFRRVYGDSSDAIFLRRELELRLVIREGGVGVSLVRNQFGKPLAVLMAAVVVLLLAACANIAQLLLARGAARRKEIALRLSLGATRCRLVGQALTESLVVAAGGSAVGAVLAWLGRQYILHFLPAASGNPFDASPHATIVFAAGASLISAALFGVAPALRSTAVDPAAGPRGEDAIPRGRRGALRAGLVVAQVAFSVVLVALAALFGGSLGELRAAGGPLRNPNVITFEAAYAGASAAMQTKRRFLSELEATPGVASVSSGSPAPYQTAAAGGRVRVPGSAKAAEVPAEVEIRRVADRYFETLGTPLRYGREFNRGDAGAKWDDIAVVNQAFVRELMSGDSHPASRTFDFDGGGASGKPMRIIGVVEDLPHQGLRQQAHPTVYLRTDLAYGVFTVVATSVPARVLLPEIRRRLAKASLLVFTEPRTVESQIEESIFQDRILASLSGFFGVVALLLAAVGLYGMVAYKTAQRTGEIGVRIALGAGRGAVVWLVLRDALALVAMGLAIGLPAAAVAARAAGSIVFGVRTGDPRLFAATALALLAVGAVAAFLPARRAAGMDPMQALRHE